jgi:hypothetical protein
LSSQPAANIEIQTTASSFNHFSSSFPELISLTTFYDGADHEIRARAECDLHGMRRNQKFMTMWSAKADGYDAYIRAGLEPWSTPIDRVYELIDGAFGSGH